MPCAPSGRRSHDQISHADNGRGVHAAAEFGEDGTVGAEPTLHRCSKGGAKVFFVFGVGAVANAFTGIELPIFADNVVCAMFAWSQQDRTRWWDGLDAGNI